MIIAIVGPTGVGKTKMSVELAKKYNAIIVNADAMQVYKGLNIGTAKIKETEKAGIPHYLFDICDPDLEYTVYDYQKDARKIIEKNNNKNIIFVGGTGLYLKAALYDYKFLSSNLRNNYDNLSNEELFNLCFDKDPKNNIHVNNRQRMVSFLNRQNTKSEIMNPIYNFVCLGLTTSRDKLYDIINKRVDIMINDGLVKEAKSLFKYKDFHALKTAIGYKEIYKYLDNEITKEEAIDLIKKNSRHYAKRQYTFFNNQMNVNWINVDFDNYENTINEAVKIIEEISNK